MDYPLSKYCDVRSGYSFRGSVPNLQTGDLHVIQATNLQGDLGIDLASCNKVQGGSNFNHQLLSQGDVLLVSRSTDTAGFRSVVFEFDNPAIASVTLHVLRADQTLLLPSFLCAFLNSTQGQSQMARWTTGSSVKMLSLGALRKMKIPIPSLEVQMSFSALTENVAKQKQLLQRKQLLLDRIRTGSATQIIK